MATEVEEWSRNCCSICMEPFRGRNPKFLPCFHTFCVPCLIQLEERARAQTVQPIKTRQGRNQPRTPVPVSIVCPTCRKPTVVPAEGVASFQTNFYIDDEDDHPPQPKPRCDLCDEGHEAKFACNTCPSKFCRCCLSVHDRICDWAVVVYEINDSAPDGSSSEGDLATKVKVVSAKVQRLEKLTEVTPMLTRELNVAQEKSTNMRSDMSSLQSEQTSLKGRLNTLDSCHQSLSLKFAEATKNLQDSGTKQQQNIDDLRTAIQILRSDFNTENEEQKQSITRYYLHVELVQAIFRENYNELFKWFDEHVGPNDSGHAKLDERIETIDTNVRYLEGHTQFSVKLIVGLLILASIINGIVLAIFYSKFVV